MTTPTGTIKLSDVRLEIYGSATGQIDMNDPNVHILAGVANTASVSMSQLKGKTWATFSPVPGTYNTTDNNGVGSDIQTITAANPVTWTWSASPATGLTSTVASGGSANSISFTLAGGTSAARSSTVTVTVGSNTWTLNMTASATGGGGSTVTL